MSPIPAVYVMGILSLQSSLLDVVTYFRHKNVLLKSYLSTIHVLNLISTLYVTSLWSLFRLSFQV